MTDQKPHIPFESAVMPEVLEESTKINFRCYKGISCFNACCKNADVTLAPYDIIRLKRRLGMTSTDFLAKHTVPFLMDADGTPGVKPKTTDEGACLLLDGDNGCSVYTDRPTVCRYYPVALLLILTVLWPSNALISNKSRLKSRVLVRTTRFGDAWIGMVITQRALESSRFTGIFQPKDLSDAGVSKHPNES